MKSLLLSLVIVSSTAFANLQPAGTFVANQCSPGNAEAQVCVGYRVSVPGEYVSLRAGRAFPVVFLVKEKVPFNGGINPAASAATLTLVDQAGNVVKAEEHATAGKLITFSFSFFGKTYTVGNFENMAHAL